MPSHTVHSALTQMYVTQNGAPWDFPLWKELTGVKHGLFPDDDALLPTDWDREKADNISIYFDQFKKVPTEEERIKFSSSRPGSSLIAGRDHWRRWVTALWQEVKIHSKITEILRSANLDPLTLTLSDGGGLNSIPHNSTYLPLAVDEVGWRLYGGDACNSLGFLRAGLRPSTLALMQRTWINGYNQVQRASKRLVSLEMAAVDTFNGLGQDVPSGEEIKDVVSKVSQWKTVVVSLGIRKDLEKVVRLESQLSQLMDELGANMDAEL